MKIKKKLQFLFKKIIQIVFFQIYGKINYIVNNDLLKNLKIQKIEIDLKNYYLYQIKNGRVYTDYVENVAIIDNNRIVEHASYQQVLGELLRADTNSVLKKGTPRYKKNIKGTVVSLIQGASGNNNYFHWMFDILPKLELLRKFNKLQNIDYFYLPSLQAFQKETLSMLKIPLSKCIDSKKYRHIKADLILAVSHPWYQKGYILEETKNLQAWTINWVYESFISYSKKFSCNKKIFIDRSESKFNHCQIINNNEVKYFLSNLGYSIYKTGELSIPEQIYLFNNAEIIIGAHGAAFTNLVFCKPNTKIIEIIPDSHPNQVNKKISEVKKLNYFPLKTSDIEENQKLNGDIIVPLKTLENLLTN
jgi:capsular polysaccharide biosynthesis protein